MVYANDLGPGAAELTARLHTFVQTSYSSRFGAGVGFAQCGARVRDDLLATSATVPTWLRSGRPESGVAGGLGAPLSSSCALRAARRPGGRIGRLRISFSCS